MRLEPTPASEVPDADDKARPKNKDQWIDVCSTLIADASTFTIQRLTLKRKIQQQATSADRSQESIERPPSEPAEEIITTEPVTDFDTTLAEAIDRALNHPPLTPSAHASRNPSPSRRTHSRTVSSSTTKSATAAAQSLTPPTASHFIFIL